VHLERASDAILKHTKDNEDT